MEPRERVRMAIHRFRSVRRFTPGCEKRPDVLAAHDAGQESGLLPRGDHGGDTPFAGQSRCPDLGLHSAHAGLTLVIGDVVIDLGADLDRADHLGTFRGRVTVRGPVTVRGSVIAEPKHAGDRAQDHEQVGRDQARHECR